MNPFTLAECDGLRRSFRNVGLDASPIDMEHLLNDDVPQGTLIHRVFKLNFEVVPSPSTQGRYEYHYRSAVRSLRGPVQMAEFIQHDVAAPPGYVDGQPYIKEWLNPLVPVGEIP